MVRKLAVALASLALSTSTSVYALGLGNIELHSALNQPLNADIELFSAQPAELDGMQIGLASNEIFEQAGVDRPQWLSQIKFSVTKDVAGQSHIKVTSSQPIQEPFMTFLLEVNWSDGRLVREYTLLLDPPEFAQGHQVAVTQVPVVHEAPAETPRMEKQEPVPDSAPSSEATTPETTLSAVSPSTADTFPSTTDTLPPPADEPPLTADASSSADDASPAPANAGRSYGPVKRNETLWSIASQLRPNSEVSVEQMMLALVRLNSDAFNKGNINRLKKGYVLRVPEVDEIKSVAKAEAAREVRRQNAAWREYRRNMAGATTAETGADAPAAKDSATPPVDAPPAAPVEKPKGPRLKLVPAAPENPKEPTSGAVANVAEPEQSADGQKAGSLQEQLALAKETAAARGQESEELRGRVAELEKQIANDQRLLELRNNEIADLQNRLKANETEKPAGAPPETPATAKQQPKPEQPKPVRVDAKKPAVQPPAPSTPAEPEGLLADLLNNPMILLLGSLVLLVASAAWVVVRRRRMMNSGFQESILMPQATGVSKPTTAATATALGSEGTSFLNDSIVTGVKSIGTEVGETDPLAEADIYIAYGRYQQAEELISRALEKEPERVDLMAKLLEIHHGTKDRKAFEPLAQKLHTLLGGWGPLWDRVVVMGRELCPENPLFGGTPSAAEIGQGGGFEETTPFFAEMPSVEEELGFGTQGTELLADNMFGSNADLTMFESVAEMPAEESQAKTEELPALEFEFDKQGLDWSGEPGLGASAPAQAELAEGDSLSWQGAEEQKEELSLFSNFDEVGTKLDLARVYIDMGDAESARNILDEVLEEGNEEQKREAQRLLQQTA